MTSPASSGDSVLSPKSSGPKQLEPLGKKSGANSVAAEELMAPLSSKEREEKREMRDEAIMELLLDMKHDFDIVKRAVIGLEQRVADVNYRLTQMETTQLRLELNDRRQ
mmetsp:Transcript_9027/g.10439  ORF Transcript_9027/g.10439 Transcript_9027/m.10439 type:complete len:109 (-) Transcript_9027:570-896(-)